jgi:hypothetical protein
MPSSIENVQSLEVEPALKDWKRSPMSAANSTPQAMSPPSCPQPSELIFFSLSRMVISSSWVSVETDWLDGWAVVWNLEGTSHLVLICSTHSWVAACWRWKPGFLPLLCNFGQVTQTFLHFWLVMRPRKILQYRPHQTVIRIKWARWMACTCSSSYLGGWGGRIAWTQEFETNLGNIVKLSEKERERERENIKWNKK